MRIPLFAVVFILGISSCKSEDPAPEGTSPPPAPRSTEPQLAVAPASADVPATPEPAPPPAPDPVGEFDAEVQLLYRIAACAGDAALPPGMPSGPVAEHCTRLERINERYRTRWLDIAVPFLRELVPEDVPERVIYPFGGEDLVSALAVFPEARELTIISLEEAQDPRPVRKLDAAALATALERSRQHVAFLADVAFHRTEDLEQMAKNPLPQQLVGALWGLAMHARVPVSLRFFVLGDDGSIAYVTDRFESFELTFRRPGGPLQTYRHVAANLANWPLKKNPAIAAYLEQRAPFAAIVKAASFLLWKDSFSTFRELLLANATWIISDATAPLPVHARAAGFEQIPYGRFTGPEVAFDALPNAQQMVALWAAESRGPVPMRWGYYDAKRQQHLLITRRLVDSE